MEIGGVLLIRIVKELNIEVTKPNVFQALVAKQYDMNTRFLKVTLTDNGTKINVPYSGDVKVVINAERKDGQAKGFDGEVNEDGTVTVPLHSWMLELEGLVTCDISVIKTTEGKNKKLTTTSFDLMVEKAAYGGDDITTDPQYDVLVELIEKVEEMAVILPDITYNPESENAQSGIAVAEAIKDNVSSEELNQVVTEATTEVTKVFEDVYSRLGDKAENDERFAVFRTDLPLTKKTGDNWLTFKQAKYGCGYGTDTKGDYTIPKVGDLLICRTNGWFFKVAGVQKEKETICAWYIASGTGDIDVADKAYVDEKMANIGTKNFAKVGLFDLNGATMEFTDQPKEVQLIYSIGIMNGYCDLTITLSNNTTIGTNFGFDNYFYHGCLNICNNGGFISARLIGLDRYQALTGLEVPQYYGDVYIKKIQVTGYPQPVDYGDGPFTQPFENANVYVR